MPSFHSTPPESLPLEGYQLLESFSFNESLPFFQRYLKRRNRITNLYVGLNLLILAIIGWWLGVTAQNKTEAGLYLLAIFQGCALTFLLIPIHELLHALAYRLVGATRITYSVAWRKLMFFTIADGFVISPQPFRWVILTPFLVLTTLAIGAIYLSPVEWQFRGLGFILMHTAACSGDFALLSFLHENRHRTIRTYDDATSQMSFFYAKD